MPETLLRTKLFAPPKRPSLVSRPHLVKKLNHGLQPGCILTLVSAPAGFGKTTLVGEWVQSLQESHSDKFHRIAWLSLDAADNDLARFLRYLVTAVSQSIGTDSAIGKRALTLLQSPQPPPAEAILTPVVNEIAAIPESIILVLDDYHLIEAQPVHDALSFCLERSPPQMHLVVATREDPPLPLPRFRARAQLTELRAIDLRFSTSEAADFLNRIMGLDLSAEDIAALETRTEGWITGLQLAAISMQGSKNSSEFIKSFTGSHRYVLDYLIEEVLAQQPDDLQHFLLQTAVLDRLTGPLCDELTGQKVGQLTLEKLEHGNLFIVPLDEERQWYRYHHLFADLLHQRLKLLQPDQIPSLHHRASQWFEQNGFAFEAIEHALRGDDFDHAGELIDRHIDNIWGAGQHAMIQRWVSELPDTLVLSTPHLCIFHAWYLFVNGQRELAEYALQAALRAIESKSLAVNEFDRIDKHLISHSEKTKLKGRAAAVQAFMASYHGDISGIIQHAREAYDFLPEKDFAWRCLTAFVLGDALLFQDDMEQATRVRLEAVKMSQESGHYYLILIANLRLAETLRYQGKLSAVSELCQQQMQFVEECGISQTVAAGWLTALWGDVLAESNDLDEAIKQVRRGVKLAGHGGRDVAFVGWSNLYLLRVLFSRGELAKAEKVIQKMQKIDRKSDLPILASIQISAWQGRIWVVQDKMDAAAGWVKDHELIVDGELSFLHESENIVFARILLAQGRFEEAKTLLQRLLTAAEAGERLLRVIEILLLQSLVHHSEDNFALALSALTRALTLAQADGFFRLIVDEGPPMAQLLAKARDRGIAPGYIDRLLAAFSLEKLVPEAVVTQMDDSPEWLEPLSERELEILQIMAEGFTNREIADRLFLSLNTVKVHTRNIYGKLDVHNRTQAIAKARALGILPSM